MYIKFPQVLYRIMVFVHIHFKYLAKEHLEKIVNDLTPIRNSWLKSEEFDKTI